ncbi:MAG: tyrosine--tRNA ligase [Desulfobacteraceae bacterium]|jgi:tyrosyl-tRNA synthetase
MGNALDVLQERGFVENTTHDQELRDYLAGEGAACYIGFDPTADSLHVGHLIPIMALAQMQRLGHRPIALVGGGTGMVGDPSGKTEMRNMLTLEMVEENARGIKGQLSRFLDFSQERALLLNNADWLVPLKYISFLREVGRHFSVNRMIKAESYRMRIESEEGLSFIEFNYMVLQAYDFLELSRRHNCLLQMGGSDQWGNIVAGIDLIRREEQKTAFGITFPLITTSSGAKMGKTARGAVWLDPHRTSPYEYFQFWVNTDDRDVQRFLSLFTLLPMSEIIAAVGLQGAALNSAKAVLAYEATRLAHGSQEADKAYAAAQQIFGSKPVPHDLLPSSTIPRQTSADGDETAPSSILSMEGLKKGVPAFKLFHQVGLSDSGGAARRLIEQGGGYLNGNRLETFDYIISDQDLQDGQLLLRAGKKKYHRIVAK